MEYTQVRETLFEEIQINAGIMLAAFEPSTGSYKRSDIIGATSGGVSFSATPEYSDFGEDIDNVPNNTKELKHIESIEAKMSGTFVSANADMVKRLISAADAANGKITPRADLVQADFQDLWWVGDYNDGSGGFIAVRLMNALNTGGFQIQTTDRAKGTYAFEFTGHYTIADVSLVPYEVYVASTAPNAGGGGNG